MTILTIYAANRDDVQLFQTFVSNLKSGFADYGYTLRNIDCPVNFNKPTVSFEIYKDGVFYHKFTNVTIPARINGFDGYGQNALRELRFEVI